MYKGLYGSVSNCNKFFLMNLCVQQVERKPAIYAFNKSKENLQFMRSRSRKKTCNLCVQEVERKPAIYAFNMSKENLQFMRSTSRKKTCNLCVQEVEIKPAIHDMTDLRT